MKESKERLNGSRVVNPLATVEFSRDLPYMKKDIWGEGVAEARDESANAEIYRMFGHDEATYPNIDNPQHYANVQFAGSMNASVLKDQQTKRTPINKAARAIEDNANGKFARDGDYMRSNLWNADVESTDVTRTDRGNRQDLNDITSREGSWESKHVFEHDAGYQQSDIFEKKAPVIPEEPEEPEEPKEPEVPEVPEEPECPAEAPDCEPGTLGNALAHAEKAEADVDKIIPPVGEPKSLGAEE